MVRNYSHISSDHRLMYETDEMAAAIHTLDSLMQPAPAPRSVEATAMLASLRANPRAGVSTSEVSKEKATARELFERVIKALELPEDLQRRRPVPSANGESTPTRFNRSARNIADDVDMHTEIAKLWQGENLEVMALAVKEALRINEASSAGSGVVDPRLMNNLGVLRHLDGTWKEAREIYELALTRTAASGFSEGELGEGVATTILYNLARVYEDQGEVDMAREAYEKLLSRHPEYIDGMSWFMPFYLNVSDAHNHSQDSAGGCARKSEPQQRCARPPKTSTFLAADEPERPRHLYSIPHSIQSPQGSERFRVLDAQRPR